MQIHFVSHCMHWVVAQKLKIYNSSSRLNIQHYGRDPRDHSMNSKSDEESDYEHGVDLLTFL